MLIFDHNEYLPPEELAQLSGASVPMIVRAVRSGCPNSAGGVRYADFVAWMGECYERVLLDFSVSGFPASGHYCELSYVWLVRPAHEWQLDEERQRLFIGGPGVDGISWVLKVSETGVFGHYPIGDRIEWIADGWESLKSDWESGNLSV